MKFIREEGSNLLDNDKDNNDEQIYWSQEDINIFTLTASRKEPGQPWRNNNGMALLFVERICPK